MTVVLLTTLVTGAGADARWPRAPLPPDVRRALDQQYPGWRFASIIDSLKAQLPEDASPEWIAGDYDGDRQRDYAVQIVRPGSLETPQLVLALLRRGSRYEMHTLTSLPVQQAAYLRMAPKGQVLRDVDRGTKFAASTDVIDVLYGQEAGEAFIYDKGRFRKIISGD